MKCALELLDIYATIYPRSDLLMYLGYDRPKLKTLKSMHQIPEANALFEYLFQKYFDYLFTRETTLTLVFIGSGNAALETFVTLHLIGLYNEVYQKRFDSIRVILCDTSYASHQVTTLPDQDLPVRGYLEAIFKLAKREYPEIDVVFHDNVETLTLAHAPSDNYKNTVYFSFNLAIQMTSVRLFLKSIENDQRNLIKSRYISCTSIPPFRGSNKNNNIWCKGETLAYILTQYTDVHGADGWIEIEKNE